MPNFDEERESQLRAELERREKLRREGKCDYCGKNQGSLPSCRFPERHAGRTE